MSNRLLNGDFEFLSGLLNGFFLQERIVKQLNLIEKEEITGWEIWLQIELAFFLDEQENVVKWVREVPLSMDNRIEKLKSKGIVDFWIREKNKSTETMIALELKQAKSAKSCITAMMKDLNKFHSLKPTHKNFIRTFWCVGVHRSVEDETCRKIINEHKAGYTFNENHILSKKVDGTNFGFTML